MSLFGIVVAYGNADLLRITLQSLETTPVCVVDNSSSSDVRVVAERAGAHYIDPGANLGFGAGVNLGAQLAPLGADLLVVNPDAELHRGCATALAKAVAAHPRTGVAAPMLVSRAGQPQRVQWPWPSSRQMALEACGLGRLNRNRDWVVGAVMLLKREAWDDVGGFDERFFLYQEETDWQRRASLRGWHSIVVTEATAQHVGAGTSSDARRREALFYAGTETYIRKWEGPWGWRAYRTAALAGAVVRSVLQRGAARAAARRRAALYVRGPRRVAGLDRAAPRKVASTRAADASQENRSA